MTLKGNMESLENRLSYEQSSSEEESFDEDSDDDVGGADKNVAQKSGMANVISRILSKDTSKSSRILLAKGKTNKEILDDITRRRQKRGEHDDSQTDAAESEVPGPDQRLQVEKRKLWENMGRKTASDMDISRELKLRKIATQGMVQLFQSVHDHQKIMNQKIASVGPSERKKDKVIAEFTKGKFLDVLKSKSGSRANSESDKQDDRGGGKWKILQDDFMMGAQMKDWDKDDDDEDNNEENQEEPMSDDMSD